MLPASFPIVQVVEVIGASDAQRYLDCGWMLLCVVPSGRDDEGKIIYSLGRPSSVTTAPDNPVQWL